jgi:hypothetical protein
MASTLSRLIEGLGHLLDVLWTAIQPTQTPLRRGIQFEPELGRYHHLSTEGSEGFAHELFVRERTVRFGGIEECDATLDGLPEQRDHLLLVCGGTVAIAHAHAAEPDRRDFQVAASELALLHFVPLIRRLNRPLLRHRVSRAGPASRLAGTFLEDLSDPLDPARLRLRAGRVTSETRQGGRRTR